MTATTAERLTEFAGLVPAQGTLPMLADKLILKKTIVTVDADGRATPGVDGEGFAAVGAAQATTDNRTSSPLGGANDAIDVEVEFGIFGWLHTGGTPDPGQVVFVVDNQTVSVDSSGGTRGIAGYVSEVRDVVSGTSNAFVLMGPTIAGQIVIAAAEAVFVDELQADATSADTHLQIPLNAWRLDTGASIPAFSDGVSDGFELTSSEAFGIRFNNSVFDQMATSIMIPNDLDETANVILHVSAFREGAADATAVLTFGAFFQPVGAAHDADADAGGNTSFFDGADGVVTEETLTIALADVPAAPASLTLTMVPSAALDADDLVVIATWLEYTRKLLT